MIGWREGAIASDGGQTSRHRSHRIYGTEHVGPLPGISCQATLVSSLRDKG